MIDYKLATIDEIEKRWDKEILENIKEKDLYLKWKKQFVDYNKKGLAKTFVAINDEDIFATVTILLSKDCKAVFGKDKLCNGKDIANINALRCDKMYEGQGHISKLMAVSESWAKINGIKTLTIGAEATESRNLSIYLHWKYDNFLMWEIDKDENSLVLYYGKQI